MFVLGLTGGIAGGKGHIARLLRERGAVHIDADAVARELVQPGRPLLGRLVEEFGPEILAPDGSLDRARLGRLAFADLDVRARLNRLAHPPILAEIRRRLEELRASAHPPKLVVAEMPLLYEAGAEYLVDKVLVVHADERERIRRITRRDGLSAEHALTRIRAQMPPKEQLRRADLAIDTSGTPEETDRRFADELWPAICAAMRAKCSRCGKQ